MKVGGSKARTSAPKLLYGARSKEVLPIEKDIHRLTVGSFCAADRNNLKIERAKDVTKGRERG